ncbi:class I SAM-dependent methyltransferase, partial [bacterium]|nr:class I SAM-dependent methyltransferase [bacterium]
TPSAQTRRLEDIRRYVNHNYQGLTYFIKDLGDFLKQNNVIEALDLYDRIRWDMLPTPELEQIDETITRIRLTTFSNQTILKQLDQNFPSHLETTLGDQFFKSIYRQIRPYTMLSEQRLYSLYKHAKRICEQDIPGNFIECGVAAGGSSALLAATIKKYSKQIRRLFAFDSFSGMPKPGKYDTASGVNAEDTGWGTGTCAAPEESVKQICRQLNVNKLVITVKGYFAETLPPNRDRVGMIAFLHLDGDWYDSTMIILKTFYNRVVFGGFLQVDDYGHWAGCHKAIHEFADNRKLSFEINDIDGTGVWIPKNEGFPINPEISEKLATDFNKIDPVSHGVMSQMSTNERFQLFYTVNQMASPLNSHPLRFIEIGSFSGASLLLFYSILKQKGITFSGYSVEPYGTQQFKTIVSNLQPEITHLKTFSDEAVKDLVKVFEKDNNRPQFIFVDGDPLYTGVCKDIENYYPLLAPGGYMIFHDYLPELNEQNREAILSQHAGKE